MLRRVTRRRGRCPCGPGCDAGSREPAASKEIEGLGELMDGKSLLSGLPFGLSAVARAPSRRKVTLPLQSPGYWRRCHPVNEQVLIRKTATNNKYNKNLKAWGLPLTRSCRLVAVAPKQWVCFPFCEGRLSWRLFSPPGLFGHLMVIFDPPEFIISLRDTMIDS